MRKLTFAIISAVGLAVAGAGVLYTLGDLPGTIEHEAKAGVRTRLTNPDSAVFEGLRTVERNGETRVCGNVTAASNAGPPSKARFIWQSRIGVAQIERIAGAPDCAALDDRELQILCSNGRPDPAFEQAWISKC